MFFRVFVLLFILTLPIACHQSFKTFNEIFLNAYAETRHKFLQTVDPLIVVNGGDVTLIRGKEKSTINSQPEFYSNLKTITHIPFVVYLRLFDVERIDRNLSSDELTTLKSYLRKVRLVRHVLNVTDFLSDQSILQTQFDIVDMSITYLRKILRSKQLNITALQQFCDQTRAPFARNVRLGARAHLDRLHAIVYPWYRETLNETERQTVQVLILGPKTPREGSLMKQYFQKLLGLSSVEGQRLIYGENLSDVKQGLDVLGSWLLDRYAGEAFFNDQTRLHRDLMIKDAADYIQAFFPSWHRSNKNKNQSINRKSKKEEMFTNTAEF